MAKGHMGQGKRSHGSRSKVTWVKVMWVKVKGHGVKVREFLYECRCLLCRGVQSLEDTVSYPGWYMYMPVKKEQVGSYQRQVAFFFFC